MAQMKIESRVEALELDLKILKNEIQATLLEIQEQVLNHYYPELRAEEPSQPKPRMDETRYSDGRAKPATGSIGAKSAGYAEQEKSKAPFADVFLQDMEVAADELAFEEEDDEPLPPVTQRMAGALTRVALIDTPATGLRGTTGVASKPNRSFAALAAWVSDAVTKVGKPRTLQIIDTYASSGDSDALAPDMQNRLRQLVALAQDEEPQSPVGAQAMLGLLIRLDEILTT